MQTQIKHVLRLLFDIQQLYINNYIYNNIISNGVFKCTDKAVLV